MIEFNLEPNTRTIESINFEYGNVHINGIAIKYLQIRDFRDEKNIGGILEKFRKNKETEIEQDKYKNLKGIIKEADTNLNGFKPTHLIVLKSHHQEITNLTNLLNYNILSNNDIYPENISDCFLKNSDKSITEYDEQTDEFLEEYSLNEDLLTNKYFDRLLIVDDVIKKGRVINQLLIRLAKNGNIDNLSKIFIYTIYSFNILL